MRKELGKKGAIELSMNTIIIVVIGITILTLGLRWIYGIFGGLTEQSTQIEQISQDQINELFGKTGDVVRLPSNIVTVQKGKTKNAQVFIRNKLPETHKYKYIVTPDEGTVPAGSVTWYKQEVELKSSDGFKDFVRFDTTNLVLKTYSFRINVVCTDCNPPQNEPPVPLILEVVAK